LPSRVNDYVVEQSTGVAGIVLSGPLGVGDADRRSALQAAGARLGVDLTAGPSFMLVRLVRDAGKAVHPWTEGEGCRRIISHRLARQAASRLPCGSDTSRGMPTAEEARKYLEFFAEYGTHFCLTNPLR
jgi:hypothetical protein